MFQSAVATMMGGCEAGANVIAGNIYPELFPLRNECPSAMKIATSDDNALRFIDLVRIKVGKAPTRPKPPRGLKNG